VLSLEAPLVAVVWQWLLARAHHVHLFPSMYAGLALAVWGIYLVDRTLDARRARAEVALGVRHEFYRRHPRVIVFFLLPLIAGVLVWLALWHIPLGSLFICVGVGMMCAFYLAAFAGGHVQSRGALVVTLFGLASIFSVALLPVAQGTRAWLSVLIMAGMWAVFLRHVRGVGVSRIAKEPVAAMLIAMGCSAGVWFFTSVDGPMGSGLEMVLMWGVFFCNLAGISAAERAHDGGQGDAHSLAKLWPGLARWYLLLPCALVALCVITCGPLAEAVLVSACAMAVLWLVRGRLSPEMYRALADVCLLLPVVPR
jgi:hypothetical protein